MIASREIQRVDRIMSMFCEKHTETTWQMRIKEKLHFNKAR